jgi:hypothetical protein
MKITDVSQGTEKLYCIMFVHIDTFGNLTHSLVVIVTNFIGRSESSYHAVKVTTYSPLEMNNAFEQSIYKFRTFRERVDVY